MAYNYQGPPGQYGRPSSYGGYPGQSGAPPGMGMPPGMSMAPGVAAPPGMQQSQQPGPGGFGPNFNPQQSMPNFNFSAPVIRMDMPGKEKPSTPITGGSARGGNMEPVSNRRGMGLGYDSREQQRGKDTQQNITLPQQSREEVQRTLFIANLTESFGNDAAVERILNAGTGLRKWTRALQSDVKKPCTFGFAEYESADHVAIAIEILEDVQIKSKHQPKEEEPKTNGVKKKEDEDVHMKTEAENDTYVDGNVHKQENDIKDEEEDPDHQNMLADESLKMDRLLVFVDDATRDYISQWKGGREDKKGDQIQERQFAVDTAKEELRHVLYSIANPAPVEAGEDHPMDGEVLQLPTEIRTDEATGEVVTIPLSVEDELSDIPADMRDTVKEEIQAFRNRSIQRDLERLKQEEELEARERALDPSSSAHAPSGGNANNVPLGPRGQGPAPTAPKSMTGVQLPKDLQNGVTFVNGGTANGMTGLNQEDEDSEASDEELERRRQEKRNAELEKMFLDQERRWMNRERSHAAAIAREEEDRAADGARTEREKDIVRARLAEWDDDKEASAKREEYYADRSVWLRNRAKFRAHEAELDEADRRHEERERQMEQEMRNKEAGIADAFLEEQAKELEQELQKEPAREPMRFKMTLGSAAKRDQQVAQAPRRSMAALEGLLEDEEDVARRERSNRQLMPIAEDANKNSRLSAEERQRAARRLAQEIPGDRRGLWTWDVKWEHVHVGVLSQLREFVEKKIMEALGVMEERQVDAIEDAVKRKAKPQEIVEKMTPVLHDEAESFVRKLWRMLIFLSESEKRGLSD